MAAPTPSWRVQSHIDEAELNYKRYGNYSAQNDAICRQNPRFRAHI